MSCLDNITGGFFFFFAYQLKSQLLFWPLHVLTSKELSWSSNCHHITNSYLDNLKSAIHDSNVFLDLCSIELRFDVLHSNANIDVHCYFSRCFVPTNTRWKFSQHLPNWNQSSRVHKWFSKIKSKSRFQREFHTGEVIVQGDEFFQFQNVWQETT